MCPKQKTPRPIFINPKVCEFILCMLFSCLLMVACQKIKVIKGHASSRKGESNQMRGTCWSYLRDSDFRPAQALSCKATAVYPRTLFSELLKPHILLLWWDTLWVKSFWEQTQCLGKLWNFLQLKCFLPKLYASSKLMDLHRHIYGNLGLRNFALVCSVSLQVLKIVVS